MRSFLAYDWDHPDRAFVDVERAFGEDEPVALKLGERTLYVRGFIDRLDTEGDVTLVRDLKTGSPHPRSGKERGPVPVRDVQLALYTLVVKQLARRWGLPGKVQAAYAYAADRGERERAFRDDVKALTDSGKEWLALAAELLATRSFPATTDGGDCAFCGFAPLCGAGALARSEEVLSGAEGALASFREIKNPEERS